MRAYEDTAMTPEEREQFYIKLTRIMRRLERTYERVYPWMIIPHLEFYRCEQTLRRDMRYLAERGDLVRVGGFNARRGYAVPRLPAQQVAQTRLH